MHCSLPLVLLLSLFGQVSTGTTRPVASFELFRPDPVRFEMFAPEPVTFNLFAATAVVKKPIVFDPEHEHEKDLVPPPIEFPPTASAIPIVHVYTTSGCERCEAARREYDDALQRGTTLPFRFRFERSAPAWVESFPTLHFRGREGWKKVEGWPGLDEFTRQFRAATVRQQPTVRASERLKLPQPASRWSYPGHIADHLREHGWTGSLEGMSIEEMERIHSALHEGLIQADQTRTSHLESRAAPSRGLPQTRTHVRKQLRQFDPFLVTSILGLVWNVATVLCGNCGR